MANLDYDTFRIVHNASAAGEYSLTDDRLYLVGACSISDIKVEFGLAGERSAGATVIDATDTLLEGPMDGAMLNPAPGTTNRGYDGRNRPKPASPELPDPPGPYGYLDTANRARAGFPIAMVPGDVLIISESADPTVSHNGIFFMPLKRAIAVHCVAAAPSVNDFAPPYCGTKTTHTWSAGLLDNLPETPLAAPDPIGEVRTVIVGTTQGAPTAANLSAKIAKLQLDHFITWTGRYMHPYINMRDYGASIAYDWTDALVMACTDGRDTALVQHVVQVGIDLYGIYEAGGSWPADGGHNMGRKAMMMFAGKVLGNTAMQQIGFQIDRIQEDEQAYYDGATAKWRIRSGQEGLGLAYEGTNRPRWMGQAFAMLYLGLASDWGNNAYFEYLDDARTAGFVARRSYVENTLAAHWATQYAAADIGPSPNPICRVIPGVFS